MTEILTSINSLFKDNFLLSGSLLLVFNTILPKIINTINTFLDFLKKRMYVTHTKYVEGMDSLIFNEYPNWIKNRELDFFKDNASVGNIYVYSWKYQCLIIKSKNKLEHANEAMSAFYYSYDIISYRRANIDKLLQVVENKYLIKEPKIYHLTRYSPQLIGINRYRLDKMYLNQDRLKFIASIKNFFDKKEEYYENGKLHKRGYLLAGKPGSGKSSLAIALAKELNRDVYVVTETESFVSSYANIPTGSIVLIEEIDTLKREIEAGASRYSNQAFSLMLNMLDGALSRELLVIATTNYPDKLDIALRPGRIDEIYNLNELTEEEAAEFCRQQGLPITKESKTIAELLNIDANSNPV